jgi:hypothetical protein
MSVFSEQTGSAPLAENLRRTFPGENAKHFNGRGGLCQEFCIQDLKRTGRSSACSRQRDAASASLRSSISETWGWQSGFSLAVGNASLSE